MFPRFLKLFKRSSQLLNFGWLTIIRFQVEFPSPVYSFSFKLCIFISNYHNLQHSRLHVWFRVIVIKGRANIAGTKISRDEAHVHALMRMRSKHFGCTVINWWKFYEGLKEILRKDPQIWLFCLLDNAWLFLPKKLSLKMDCLAVSFSCLKRAIHRPHFKCLLGGRGCLFLLPYENITFVEYFIRNFILFKC